MPDPVNYEDWANWPSDAELEVKRSLMRTFFDKVIKKTLPLLESWSGRSGQILVVNGAATGPTSIGDASVAAALFGNVAVRQFKAGAVPLAASASLTDRDHGGASLDLGNGSAATLTVALNADPALGVSDGFQCEVVRLLGSAAVQVAAGAGLTLRNPDGHSRVIEGGVARLRVKGADLYFWGYTET